MTCGLCGIVVTMISIHPAIPAHAGGLTPGERIGLAFRASACPAAALPAAISSLPGLLGDRPAAKPQGTPVPRPRPAAIRGNDPDCGKTLPDLTPAFTGALDAPADPAGAAIGRAAEVAEDPYRDWPESGEIGWDAGDGSGESADTRGGY